MPDQGEAMPLFAPIQMLFEGIGVMVGSTHSTVQSAVNMGAQNLQDINQTIQRGHAQFVSGLNANLASAGEMAKKPMMEASQVAAQGGAPPQQEMRQAPQPVQTTFSPIEDPSAAVRPSRGEEYYPLTMDQSNFREGGFTESPRNTDDPVQKKKIETLIL